MKRVLFFRRACIISLVLLFPLLSACSKSNGDKRTEVSDAPTVTLPAGYDESKVSVAVSSVTVPETIDGFVPAGKAYDITYNGGGISFGEDFATIRYSYKPEDLLDVNLIPDFVVFFYNTNSSRWERVDQTYPDSAAVIAKTSHFTTFVLTALPTSTGGQVMAPPANLSADYPSGIGGSSGAKFTVIDENFKYYQDREYYIKSTTVSAANKTAFDAFGFYGALGIATVNGDNGMGPVSAHKQYTGNNYISFTAHKDMDVYLMYDTRGGSNLADSSKDAPWITASGFTADLTAKNDLTPKRYYVETTDAVGKYRVYRKSVLKGELVALHGNRKGVTVPGVDTNYWVILKSKGNYDTEPAGSMATNADIAPPSNVTSLSYKSNASDITLSWINPSDSDFAGVIIRRSTSGAPVKPTDGTEPVGSVIADYSYKDSSVIAGTKYYYTVFALDSNGNYHTGGTSVSVDYKIASAVPVTGVTITESAISVPVGGSHLLSATIDPVGATNPTLFWTSSNTSVATVSVNGLVTAKSTGTAVITVKTQDGGYAAGCTVTVALSNVKSITAFSILGVTGTITGTDITLVVPIGTSLTNMIPTIVHTGSSISPASGVAHNFTSPVTYTVTAEDGSTKEYLVTVAVPGTAQWARTTVSAETGDCGFANVTSDSLGNTYVAGSIKGTETVTFGPGLTVTGSASVYCNAVIVKYNAAGEAQWAKTVSTGTRFSCFDGITSDTLGNVYAVGRIQGTGTYTFGTGVTATGISSDCNSVIVKYNATGEAQWAKTVSTGASWCCFFRVTSDTLGNVYAVGYINGTGTYTFGPGVTVTGSTSGPNIVIVKYNASGEAQWSKTVSTGGGYSFSCFWGVTSDTLGNVYAVGTIEGTGTYTFGAGVTATGSAPVYNAVIVKYNAAGDVQWAKTVRTETLLEDSHFTDVTSDSSDNIYAVGRIQGRGTYTFGPGVSVTGGCNNLSTVIVKYNAAGDTQWAKTVRTENTGLENSCFNGVTSDSLGNIYVVGNVEGTGTYTFGAGVTATGSAPVYNAVIVKYNAAGDAQLVKTVTGAVGFCDVTSNSLGNIYTVGSIKGTGTCTFGNGVTATGYSSSGNALIVKYIQ